MATPPEQGESLAYEYHPHHDWQRETEDILDDLRQKADAILAQEKERQSTPSVAAANNETVAFQSSENIENQAVSSSFPLPPSVPSLWDNVRRPLLLTSCFILPLTLLIWLYNNTLKTCESISVFYKNQSICGDTPEKQDAIFEYIACDYIHTHSLNSSFIVTFGEFDKMQRDSVVPALEAHIQGDKFSFRKNIAIAYFNNATKFVNQKQMDSACWAFINSYQYFEKLDAARTNDTLKKMTQIALQSANICEAPIQLDYPSFSPEANNYVPPKNSPIKRTIKNRIESRLNDAPTPPDLLEKARYDKYKQSSY